VPEASSAQPAAFALPHSCRAALIMSWLLLSPSTGGYFPRADADDQTCARRSLGVAMFWGLHKPPKVGVPPAVPCKQRFANPAAAPACQPAPRANAGIAWQRAAPAANAPGPSRCTEGIGKYKWAPCRPQVKKPDKREFCCVLARAPAFGISPARRRWVFFIVFLFVFFVFILCRLLPRAR